VRIIQPDKVKYTLKDLTKDVLLLAAVGTVVPLVVAFPAIGLAFKPLLKKQYPPSEIKRTLKRLDEQKLITITEDGKFTKIELRDKGRKKILTYDIEELKLKRQKWDGWWRVVIFDIPEKNRDARDFLRAKLREVGFYKLQKSVLVTPWDCKDIVDFVKHYYQVGEYVDLVLAKQFANEQQLKNYFRL
jgi:phenylacetic acid degradation operon negative regulatory protein